MRKNHRLAQRLERMHPTTAAVIAGLAAFGTYSCMYAYRKPYTAATFDGSPTFLGLDYKTALVIAQVIGYAASKFLGIKFVSETSPSGRGKRVLLLIALAQVALLAFATLPESWKVAALVLNGLPLGMVWGLVFSYLEGRRLTEVMGLILCCSFIFASAITKDVGRWVMELGASEYWMPFLVGILFAPWLLLFVWVLEHTGPPSRLDKRLRTERAPMSRLDRKVVFARFAPGLILLVAVYTMLTGYRDFRDNFLADILTDLRGTLPEVAFSRIEIPVMLLVLGALMTLVKIRDNMTAFIVNHLILLAAFVTAGVATLLFSAGWLSDTTWLITTGFSTYAAYIPFNCILFDRMIGAFKQVSNVGFFIYVADAFGYLGSVSVLLYKNFGATHLNWAEFFIGASYAMAVAGSVLTVAAMVYFVQHYRQSVVKIGHDDVVAQATEAAES